jgi:hypothetical protein
MHHAADDMAYALQGHSVGGSLAMLLMLMLRNRGVLRPENIAPVYTFGAPAIFCEGGAACSCATEPTLPGMPADEEQHAHHHDHQHQHAGCTTTTTSATSNSATSNSSDKPCGCQGEGDGCHGSAKSASSRGGSRLLAHLGLQEAVVRNVMMHKDIVPRAFSCDYTLVTDILRSWGPAFREHACLTPRGRTHLYFFTGERRGWLLVAGIGWMDVCVLLDRCC